MTGAPGAVVSIVNVTALEGSLVCPPPSVAVAVTVCEPSESVGAIYPALFGARPGSVRGWMTRGDFHDIGTPWQYLQTCLALSDDDSSRLIDSTARIASSARVSRSVLWDHATVGNNAELTECVVADRVVVPSGSRYHRCALVPADRVDGATAGTLRDGVLVVPLIEG